AARGDLRVLAGVRPLQREGLDDRRHVGAVARLHRLERLGVEVGPGALQRASLERELVLLHLRLGEVVLRDVADVLRVGDVGVTRERALSRSLAREVLRRTDDARVASDVLHRRDVVARDVAEAPGPGKLRGRVARLLLLGRTDCPGEAGAERGDAL